MGSSGTPIATFNLRGMGSGPQVVFPSNLAVNTLASSFSFGNLVGMAVDGDGDLFVADAGNRAVYEVLAGRCNIFCVSCFGLE